MHNGTSAPVLIVTGIPPSPGMQMFVRPLAEEHKPEYWPYQVFYCYTHVEPRPGIQALAIPLQRDQVGILGVVVIGYSLHLPLKVSFGEGGEEAGTSDPGSLTEA